MDRRDALKSLTLLMGGAISASTISVVLNGCKSNGHQAGLFSKQQEEILAEVADIIIPATDIPGAKAAQVGAFIAMMLNECYPAGAQKAFVKGLNNLADNAKDKYGKSFLELDLVDKKEVVEWSRQQAITELHKDADEIKASGKKRPAKPIFFVIVRDLTILGYFTSEIGTKQAQAYNPIPGHYDGCTDLKPGQKRWTI